jgi:hypothetical protein
METFEVELGERVMRYLNGGLDRNPVDSHFAATYPHLVWGESR